MNFRYYLDINFLKMKFVLKIDSKPHEFKTNPHILDPGGDPYPGSAYYIILYEPIC